MEEATESIIPTEWILAEMEKQDGTKTVEARLGLVGKTEKLLQKIRRKAPTPNNKSLKILLSLAVSQGWNIETGNIEKAFFQLDQPRCEVFVKPPTELNLPRNKVLKLNKTAFGMIDASRISYLKQINELENQDFQPLKTDPALFIYKPKVQTMCEAAGAVHAKDLIVAGKKNIVEISQRLTQGMTSLSSDT